MITIYANILRSPQVFELRDLSIYLNNAYNGLYAFDWAIADYQTQPIRTRSMRILTDFASVVSAADYLQCPQMWLSTGSLPGWMQYRGKDAALATVKDYLAQAYTCRQSPTFNSSQLATLKTTVIQSRMTTMVNLGVPSSQRDDAVATYFINPMLNIDNIQGAGVLGTSWTA